MVARPPLLVAEAVGRNGARHDQRTTPPRGAREASARFALLCARDSNGRKVDLLLERGSCLHPVEQGHSVGKLLCRETCVLACTLLATCYFYLGRRSPTREAMARNTVAWPAMRLWICIARGSS